jgi:hypothetical protein
MKYDGIDEAIRRRGNEAGITDLHAHMFRHTFAHYSKDVLNDDELMRLAGWKSRQMLGRYAASTAEERAREGRETFPRFLIAYSTAFRTFAGPTPWHQSRLVCEPVIHLDDHDLQSHLDACLPNRHIRGVCGPGNRERRRRLGLHC